jgi:PIN domain nuclease of toxin-antitoxin system
MLPLGQALALVGGVAEPRAYVTDTHPLLLHAAGGRKLGRRAALCFSACEHREAIVYVPMAVLWEASLLVRVGRVSLGRPFREFVADLFSNPAYQAHDLDVEQVSLADEARPNDDPFDALICAAARSLGLPLVTRDRDIAAWGLVRSVW